ncbi:hypothetical protein L207DRAFT_74685 [Hyaloscypha variabilis F]|uniref:Uncharacterized protein n=1 Tax=Hyaloscypha variabilis (strain UAMH 11265 / GT02V1 / F) TaxID=1149755 RepID=A0A2J6RFR4_HYAVF|nr:hypothetical protein L207DRAFT_74685 [Hyaloscypha variabilis F]
MNHDPPRLRGTSKRPLQPTSITNPLSLCSSRVSLSVLCPLSCVCKTTILLLSKIPHLSVYAVSSNLSNLFEIACLHRTVRILVHLPPEQIAYEKALTVPPPPRSCLGAGQQHSNVLQPSTRNEIVLPMEFLAKSLACLLYVPALYNKWRSYVDVDLTVSRLLFRPEALDRVCEEGCVLGPGNHC